ncbi:hypothetical protein JXA85_05640 [Candidatus Woesearchaeota archaeon]|nr:hypothetical protein [Candidatus Woesearchaeota archaeon]
MKKKKKDNKKEIALNLIIIYARYFAEITMIIGAFIFLFIVLLRAGVL